MVQYDQPFFNRFLGLLFCVSFALIAQGQTTTRTEGFRLGVGTGQDMGGIIGARASYGVTHYVVGWIGGGWALVGGGYNAGIDVRVPTKGRVSPFITGMYGYNGVIHIKGKETLDGIYYGPTLGFGLLLHQRESLNYWRFSINVPFRSQEMLDDWEQIKLRPEIEIQQDLLPITIGVGFHFGIQ